MNASLPLPPKLRRELENPAPPGGRHEQIKRLACALVGQGLTPAECFGLLRPRYGPDVPDGEIESLLRWAGDRISGAKRLPGQPPSVPPGFPRPRSQASPDPAEAIGRFLQGFQAGEEALFEASPVPLSGDWQEDARLLLGSLYAPADRVNLVWEFSLEGEKARPVGKGLTLPAADWLSRLRERGIPHGDAGAWIRLNPLAGNGVADADVGDFRFALLECDGVSLPLQTRLFSRLPLPIAALVASGGRSLHAWVRINAPDAASYRETVGEIFRRLTPLGIDPANRNPSRLARLPGVSRKIGGVGDTRQRLLYLNPSVATCQPILPA